MKRIIALLLAALMCVAVLAACGGNSGTTANTDTDTDANTDNGSAEVTVSTFDAGNISADVPDGWKAFASNDLFSDEEGKTDPDVINICKGGETDLDMLTKPYIRITYYAPETTMFEPDKDFYDDVADMDDVTIGDKTWHAFSCTSIGYKYIMMWTGEDGEDQYQAALLYESTDGSFKLEDADVQTIMASIRKSN